jgi:sarcosine oxidase / L-pipecolate oxidase
MSMSAGVILILGGGCFGLTAALELRRRGWRVTLVDQGLLPHPDAASTDISKVVRMDYAADAQHTEMGERSLVRWREWNRAWGESLYHEDGFLVMTAGAMAVGEFERDSFDFLTARGHRLRRMDSVKLRAAHPEWNAEKYGEGYLNAEGGWVESGRVIAKLVAEARSAEIDVVEEVREAEVVFEGGRCVGLQAADGREWRADGVLVAAGAWTPELLPWLRPVMQATAQTVFHFKPQDPERYRAPAFPVWGADIAKTGWYGFPANAAGLVKVANHGAGRPVRATEVRVMPEGEEARYRAFLRGTFPGLAEAPVVGSRVCLYCDTFDGAFWIDHDPEHLGLVVAAGDSGHAFKFTPVLGGLIADVVEGKPNAWRARYRWREVNAAVGDGARAKNVE